MDRYSSEDREELGKLTRQRRRALERAQAKTKPSSPIGTAEKTLISGAALALVGLGFGAPANAASFNVTNLNDSGAGSLRQAVLDANAAAGADTITFQAALTGTITLTSGQLEVTDSVAIQGPGEAVVSVSGNNASRVFYLYNNAALIDVTISGLTITQGNANIGAGIVDFDENLTLDHVTLTDNHATGDGGGLWMDGFNFVATVRDSTISGNTAQQGGGVYVEDTGGPLLFQRTTLTGNQAADGGGVYFYDPDDAITFEDSTISNNVVSGRGGGLFVYDTDGGPFTISRTTISGNSADGNGGGAYFYGPDDPVVIENSTISGNQSLGGSGGGLFLYNLYDSFTIRSSTIASNTATQDGGGIYLYSGTATLANTIVGDNSIVGVRQAAHTGVALVASDLAGNGEFDASYSLIEAPGTAALNDNGGNILNQDPQLENLQNNGGPTQTQRPANTSPAINTGDPAFTPPPATDQRGFARVTNGRIDMGAVEINPGTLQFTATNNSAIESAGFIVFTVSRTGGADGAISVSYATSDGTATAPADYAATSGTLNWADQDMANKSFQVTIVNDNLDEPDEVFTATLSNPQGGAVLGAPAAETGTILDDDVAGPVVPANIPTLGDLGKVLLAGLLGAGGLMLMRRRRGLTAPVVALTLSLGGLQTADASPVKPPKEVKAGRLQQTQLQGAAATLRLADGTTVTVPLNAVEIKDRRHHHGQTGTAPGIAGLPAGQPVVIKIKHAADGSIRHVRLQLFDTQQAAQAALRAHDGD